MDPTQPKYKAIADDLRRRIVAGEFEHGILPGISTLQGHYDAALNTIRGAQDILEGEGLIQRQQGHPTRVMRVTADEPTVDELLAKAEAALSTATALIAAARRAA
jgi:DNA-binding GntR family transcriptional regulator